MVKYRVIAMPADREWKEEFEDRFVDVHEEHSTWKKDGKNADNIFHFIEKLLSSQARALKEQVKASVPEQEGNWNEVYEAGFNDCREQTLSAIESIEV